MGQIAQSKRFYAKGGKGMPSRPFSAKLSLPVNAGSDNGRLSARYSTLRR